MSQATATTAISRCAKLLFAQSLAFSVLVFNFLSTVDAQDGDTTTVKPRNTTGIDFDEINHLRDTKLDMVFPLVCGILGLPIFGIVIAAAIYQPYAKRRKDQLRNAEQDKIKRTVSVKEKEKFMPREVTPKETLEAPFYFPSTAHSNTNLAGAGAEASSKSAV